MSKEFFDAIRSGDGEKMNAMLAAHPALLSAKDEQGLGAYTVAKYSGKNDLAALLVDKGVELDIFAACIAGSEKRVVELAGMERDCIKTYSHDGWTPLHLASFFNQPAIAGALLAYGADVNARSKNPMANTPLHAAAAGRNLEVVRLLLEHGADVNSQQHGGWTALHAASQNGDVEMLRLLIASGADVQLRAANNQSSMDLALTKGHQAVVDVLDEYAGKEPVQ